nr:spore germination protein [Neobacillus sp. Marseille-Q6967]
MTLKCEGITIGTISGGIVNFGGAFCIAPITITKTIGSNENGNGSEEGETAEQEMNSANQTTSNLSGM